MHTYLSILKLVFQSTPSVWRETIYIIHHLRTVVFQSTPSAWRETIFSKASFAKSAISIHSLRMEGDHTVAV